MFVYNVINKIFEDNAEELNAEEAKKGEQTLDKEHAEKWVKDILGDTLLSGDEHKKDPLKQKKKCFAKKIRRFRNHKNMSLTG